MIAVQKITDLAFNLSDGLTKPPEELNEEQKFYAIRYELNKSWDQILI